MMFIVYMVIGLWWKQVFMSVNHGTEMPLALIIFAENMENKTVYIDNLFLLVLFSIQISTRHCV